MHRAFSRVIKECIVSYSGNKKKNAKLSDLLTPRLASNARDGLILYSSSYWFGDKRVPSQCEKTKPVQTIKRMVTTAGESTDSTLTSSRGCPALPARRKSHVANGGWGYEGIRQSSPCLEEGMAVDLLENDERGEANHGGAAVEHLDAGHVGEARALEVGPAEAGVHLATLELGHEGGKGEDL